MDDAEFEAEDPFSQSQRDLNESMIKSGDFEVQYAPMLPFLTVPDRKAALARPFKLPAGAVRTAGGKKTLGARRRSRMGGIPAFKSPTTAATISPLSGEMDEGDENEEDATVVVAAGAGATAGSEQGFEPLVLYQSPPADTTATDAADNTAKPQVIVAVEDILCKHLREHQREGVQFVFDCIHGLKGFAGNGCILADDMGLGKTLQSITLMYTVLKQGLQGTPTARRVVVVCPTSLVANWAKEISKWVGDRIKVLPLAEASRDKAIMDINTFITTRQYSVLIISYETFRIHAQRFHTKSDSCDLLICDEAHRLKNDKTLTTQALAGLHCRRRILLSGTPMQNDLDEFWSMVDFTNPGILGDAAAFRRHFAGPILEAREPWASERQKALGDERGKELSGIVNQFILRRTNTLLSKHLPPKLMQVVCVKLSPLQETLYNHFLSSKELSLIMSGTQKGVLSSITALRKLVNHPKLIYDVLRAQKDGKRTDEGAAGFEDCEKFFPEAFHRERSSCAEMSGKFELAARMLTMLRATTTDRIVIVSCYTQTLDVFSNLCRENSWPCIRLDGSTAPGKRQKLVDKFNDPKHDEFVFLLSSKAGGCGLNLIGGNRLILFDPDWNPATDLQAAARVWRDGQRKKVYVYRFLATGTLEEKVFQRQLSKKGLQTLVVEEGDEMNSLSSEDLRNLFVINPETPSDTHDMLRCTRCRNPEIPEGESDVELGKEKTSEDASALEIVRCADKAEAEEPEEDLHASKRLCTESPERMKPAVPRGALTPDTVVAVDTSTTADCVVADNLADHLAEEQVTIPPDPLECMSACSTSSEDVFQPRKKSSKTPNKGAGTKRKRQSSAPTRKAQKAAEMERKLYEDALASAIRESLSKPLPPIEPGTIRRQLKWPQEDDLKHWSHHWSVDGIADDILKEVGRDLVTFTFGLEVRGKDPSEFGPPPPTAPTSAQRFPPGLANKLPVPGRSPAASALGSPSVLAAGTPQSSLHRPRKPGSLMRRPAGATPFRSPAFDSGAGAKENDAPSAVPGKSLNSLQTLKVPTVSRGSPAAVDDDIR